MRVRWGNRENCRPRDDRGDLADTALYDMGNDGISMEQDVAARFAFADVVVDALAHRLTRGGCEVAVEPKAFAVLLEFLAHPGQLRSRDELLDAVWGHAYVTPGTLNRLVAQLRRALGDDSGNPRCIQTVHGLGYRFIAALEAPRAQAHPVLRFAPSAQARLPERAGTLIGRDRDIEELVQALRGNRLLTIAGPGGIGKTQAALETARLCESDFPDGVWLLDCTPLAGGDALVQRVTSMFDVRGTIDTDELTARLCELLQQRRALLLFDNAERVAEPLAALAAALLASCASLHVLVTSQRRLNCVGESLHWLTPLRIPPPGEWNTSDEVAELARVPAVRLLLVRLRAVAGRFALTPANAPAVAEICRRLDGLPLALELAAARLRMLSPQQLLARLDDRLLSLAETSPGRPARHQTLHALIEWSIALLSEGERSLLRGLGVFSDGCTLGGANAIGAAFGLDEAQTIDLLGGLIDKSLLGFDASVDPPRYVLLDSVRLFALERLAASGEEARARGAHLAHFVDFTERANAELPGERLGSWHDRIRREWTNLQAAFDFAIARPDLHGDALALVGNLCWYFRGGTDYIQSEQWLERALRENRSPTLHRARALIASGVVLHQALDHERAGSRLREGIALASDIGDAFLEGSGQAFLAFELATCGDFAGAEACVEAALAIAAARDDALVRSNALLSRGVAHSLNGRHREAEASMSEAVECLPAQCDYFQLAYTLINRGLQRLYLGDLRGAMQDWLCDLDTFIRAQHWRGAAGCVEGTAYLAAEAGGFGQTARFLAAAARVREWTGAPLMPQWRKAQQATLRKAREALGDAEFDRAQQAGAAARFEDVVAEARGMLAEALATQAPRSGASNPSGS